MPKVESFETIASARSVFRRARRRARLPNASEAARA